MGAKQSTKAEKMIGQYRERLNEIESIDVIEISLEGVEKLCHELELEMNILYSDKKSAKLPEEIYASIKDQFMIQIQRFNILRKVLSLNELIPELTKLKAPINNHQETTFEREISTARQELEELKSNECINPFLKKDLISKIETELLRLNEEVIEQVLSQELPNSIKELYQRSFKQCMEIVSYYELIAELTKMKAPINKNQ